MNIAATTKISALIKANPDAVEAIASINRHFEKLRNPVLQKLLASRVTIADAARIGGCEVEAFYEKLAPLGFTVSPGKKSVALQEENTALVMPAFLEKLPPENIITLDVREDIAQGRDPFLKIICTVEEVDEASALLLVNTFEPTPLLSILARRGYTSFTNVIGPDLVHTYFWLKGEKEAVEEASRTPDNSFDEELTRFAGKMNKVDVRHLEMPQPMVTILNELEQLPPGKALYVAHRRLPQFLLPKLKERGFALVSKDLGPGEVHLIIFKQT